MLTSAARSMNDPSIHNSPPTLLRTGELIRPNPRKFHVDKSTKARVVQLVAQVARKQFLYRLNGNIYYDPFLRFTYAIGSPNTALIRKVSFSGHVKLHSRQDRDSWVPAAEDDLVNSLRLYIPFFVKFFSSLEHLTLYATGDNDVLYELPEGAPKTVKQAILPLLEGELRLIPILTTLRVLRR
jgi:hypothetical protein